MIILASDLDGTLLNRNPENDYIEDEDILAIQQFRLAGHRFGLVTGRAPSLIANTFLRNPALKCDFYIFSTGALVLDQDGKTLYEKSLPFPLVLRLLHRAEELHTETIILCDRAYSYAARLSRDSVSQMEILWGSKFLDFTPDRVFERRQVLTIQLSFDDPQKSWQLYTKLKKEFYTQAEFVYNMGSIDITASGINKCSGLSVIEKFFAHPVIPIGDGENDVDMLRSYQGFAIKSGCQQALEAARYQVRSVAEAIDFLLHSSI